MSPHWERREEEFTHPERWNGPVLWVTPLPPYLEQGDEESSGHQERNQAANEPAEPQSSCSQAHDPHGFLQPRLLLVHHPFDDHGHRVDPGQRHEKGQGAVQHTQKTSEEKNKNLLKIEGLLPKKIFNFNVFRLQNRKIQDHHWKNNM